MLTINLFDSNFPTSPSSVAYQTSQHIQYVRNLREFDGITLFTDEWVNNPIVDEVKSRYKIGWLHEPHCLHIPTYEQAQTNFHKFDLVLTYYQPLLDNYPDKCRFAIYGGVWIDKERWGIRPKTKMVSLLSGDKLATGGHKIRRQIADLANPGVIDLYGYRGQPVDYSQGTKLRTLADYRFSIVTETCRQDNLFTEWLLDCFAVGTVPIFWGCPNIGDFFDTRGILSFETVEELQAIVSSLSANLYYACQGAVWENFHLVERYAITEDWIYQNVLKELE